MGRKSTKQGRSSEIFDREPGKCRKIFTELRHKATSRLKGLSLKRITCTLTYKKKKKPSVTQPSLSTQTTNKHVTSIVFTSFFIPHSFALSGFFFTISFRGKLIWQCRSCSCISIHARGGRLKGKKVFVCLCVYVFLCLFTSDCSQRWSMHETDGDEDEEVMMSFS